jgi:hypothetical protein
MPMNVIDGIPFPPFVRHKRIEELKQWIPRPDDVYIVSYPKSGSTWLRHIVKLIKNNGIDDGVEIFTAVKWLAADRNELEKCKDIPSPRCYMCHTGYKMTPGCEPEHSPSKYIYVARNPKDVAVSYFHHMNLFPDLQFNGTWDWFFEQFLTGNVYYGLWFDHVLEWWQHRGASNVLFLKYEDMKKDLPKTIETVSSFMGCKLEPQIVDTIAQQSGFQAMRGNPATNLSWAARHNQVSFIRKGIVGDWKNYFTEDQNKRFDVEYTKRMRGSGLEFEFGDKVFACKL